MSVIYLISDNGKLTKYGDVLRLISGDDVINTIFPHRTEQLMIIGKVEITSQALKVLMLNNIDTVFLSNTGKFNGKIVFQSGKNILLRKKQFDLLNDDKFCLKLAKSIVNSKLRNQVTFLQRTARMREDNSTIHADIDRIKTYIKEAELTDNLDSLRGYEGISARHYFNSYKKAIMPDWAKFNGRSMHPPKDNVNAVLSLLYTLIMFRVDASIESFGMDPYCGYFHGLNYGSKSLAFDLMEEYRVVLGDTVTASLFNMGILSDEDFKKEEFSIGDEEYPLDKSEGQDVENKVSGVLLTKAGLKKVITRFEQKLDTDIYHHISLSKIKYRKIFFEQVKHFRRVIIGEETDYKPFEFK